MTGEQRWEGPEREQDSQPVFRDLENLPHLQTLELSLDLLEDLEKDTPAQADTTAMLPSLEPRDLKPEPLAVEQLADQSDVKENGKDRDAAEEFRPGLGNFLAVLRQRNFLLLWMGQLFSQLADKVLLVLLIGLISTHFQPQGASISGWVSAVMLAFTLPAMVLGSVAGVFVDRWLKKAVLVISNLLRGILVLLLPPLLWFTAERDLWPGIPLGFAGLLLVSFAVSTLTQFFAPAEQATLPLILPKRDLLAANSLYTTTMMASVIVGFAIGEPLLSFADRWVGRWLPGLEVGPALLVGTAYLLAGSLLWLLQPHEKLQPHHRDAPHVWEDIKQGLHYIGQMPVIKAALIQVVVLYSLFAALAVLAVRMAEVMVELDSDQFGVLLAAAGLGMGIGAFWVGHTGRRISRRTWSRLGLVLLCGALGSLAWVKDWLFPSLGLIALLGCAGALVVVPMQTLIQEETPEQLRGKIFGLQNNVVNIALSLPLVLTGVAETYLGLSWVFLGLAVLAGLSGLYTWSLLEQEEKSPKGSLSEPDL